MAVLVLGVLAVAGRTEPLCMVAAATARPGPLVAGLATGVLVHELGHATVALSKGYAVSVDHLSVVYPGATMPPSDHLQVASAGFQAQWLLAEAVLRAHERPGAAPLTSYQAGLVCSHLAITAAYLLVLKNQPTSDIVGIASATGLSRDQVLAAVALPALLDAWRLTGRRVPPWVPRLSASLKGAAVAAVWTY